MNNKMILSDYRPSMPLSSMVNHRGGLVCANCGETVTSLTRIEHKSGDIRKDKLVCYDCSLMVETGTNSVDDAKNKLHKWLYEKK